MLLQAAKFKFFQGPRFSHRRNFCIGFTKFSNQPANPPHRNKNYKSILPTASAAVISIFITLAAVWASSSSGRAWDDARQANTVAAYREFIKRWPSAIQVQNAKAALARLELRDFNEASSSNSVAAYKDYLYAWPEGTYNKLAMRRIAELD